jgi:hypothetical protein
MISEDEVKSRLEEQLVSFLSNKNVPVYTDVPSMCTSIENQIEAFLNMVRGSSISVVDSSYIYGWRFVDKQGHMEFLIKKASGELITKFVSSSYAGPHRSRRLAKRWANKKVSKLEVDIKFVPARPVDHINVNLVVGKPNDTEH